MQLTSVERSISVEFIKAAIEYEVLKPVDIGPDREDERRKRCVGDPTLIIACPGVKSVPDRHQHVWNSISERAFVTGPFGGGLRLDAVSPTNHPRNAVKGLLDWIEEGLEILPTAIGQPVEHLDLFFDYPCAMASRHNLSAQDIFRTAINVKTLFLKERYPSLKVGLRFYVDHAVDILGQDHWLIVEHPESPAFTFHFSSKAASEFLDSYETDLTAQSV